MAVAREALSRIVPNEDVMDSPEVLEVYASDHSFAHELKPCFVVKVKNVEQVKALIKLANHTGTPLVPVSSGPPHFRGDSVPSALGAVIVDLSGMKRIIHIDPRNRMALVEPGLTYAELQPELAKKGLRISSPISPRANKSVIASLLEREPIVIPRLQWAFHDPLRCREVVWGHGQRMATGEAEGKGTLEEEWAEKFAQVSPRGPGQTDFYKLVSAAQGSMGIVTWASIKCEQLPQIHKLYFVPSNKLEELIDISYEILRIRFGDELLILNNWQLASLMGKDSADVIALAGQYPQWMLLVGIAGRERMPEQRVAYQEKDLSEMAQGAGLQLLSVIPGASADEVLKTILNPSKEPYWKMKHKGDFQDIFFLSTLDRSPEFVKAMYKVADVEGYSIAEIGTYIQPIHQGASCHIEFNLPFDRSNKKEFSRVKDLYVRASEELLRLGAYYSRPYGIWAEMAFNLDAQTTIALRKIKDIFDPENIMNPGKLCF